MPYPWFRSYHDELGDPKIEELTDVEYRVWRACLNLCCRSPARLRERGYLYHSKGFPVSPEYLARHLLKPPEIVKDALRRLCEVGGESSLMLTEEDSGSVVYRIRAWRKRQRDDAGGDEEAPEIPKNSQRNPSLSPLDVDVDKTKKEKEKESKAPPRSSWSAEAKALRSIDGYPFNEEKDRALMDALAETYGQLDLAKEVLKLRTWAQAQGILPLKGQRGPRQRVRKWMQNADRFGQQDRERQGPPIRRHAPAKAEDFTETGKVTL